MEKNQSNLVQSFIERDETNIIKGIAIVFMFIHHFFTIPSLWVTNTYIYNFERFSECFKICVPLFAFLTGYFYWFANQKTFRYSIRKITDFWFCYLFAFLLISIIGFLLGVNSFSIVPFVKEIFALSRPTMIFCWYVVFYIGTMLLLPLFYRVSLINDFLAVSIFSSVPVLAIFVLKIVRLPGLLMISDFLEYFSFLPVVIIGYIIAKYDVLNVLYKRIESFGNKALKKCIYVLFLIIPFFARGGSIALDFLYAPMFVFGLCSLIKHFRNKKFYSRFQFSESILY